jgi:hypothetical protein
LRAGHLPRRRAPAGPQVHRRGRHRPCHLRRVLRDEPGHGNVASEPGLLLPARRRPDPRSRPLLHRQPDQPDRSGEARRRHDVDGVGNPHDHQRAAQRRDDPGQDADDDPGDPRIRQRRHRDADGELGCLVASPRQHGALRHRRFALRAGSELLRRRRRGQRRDKDIKPLDGWEHPFGIANQESPQGPRANYRTAGLADMAIAIIEGAMRVARSIARCTAST